jgi:hypothetical protein
MKISGLIVVILFAVAAFGQNVPSKSEPSKGEPAKTEPAKEESAILSTARTATSIAANTLNKKMDGYTAAYADDKNWEKLSRDNDIGPFLKLKEVKAGRSMVLLLSLTDDTAARVAVYFEGNEAAGVIAVQPGGKAEASAVKAVPKEALKDAVTEQGLTFTRGDLTSDDGDPVIAYAIRSSGKK